MACIWLNGAVLVRTPGGLAGHSFSYAGKLSGERPVKIWKWRVKEREKIHAAAEYIDRCQRYRESKTVLP